MAPAASDRPVVIAQLSDLHVMAAGLRNEYGIDAAFTLFGESLMALLEDLIAISENLVACHILFLKKFLIQS